MQVFEVTGRAVRREKFHVVWRCGAPWPVTDRKAGISGVTHQLRLFRKSNDPALDELVLKEQVIDDETGLPKMLKVKDEQGRLVDGTRPMMRVKLDPGTGAPVRRPLHWCVRGDGSRVVECYVDTFELAKTDELLDILAIIEVPLAEVTDISQCKDGESYEKLVVANSKPRRGSVK